MQAGTQPSLAGALPKGARAVFHWADRKCRHSLQVRLPRLPAQETGLQSECVYIQGENSEDKVTYIG